MSQFRRHPPRVLSWHAPAGSLIPEPHVIEDHSPLFPPEVVKNVRQWLLSISGDPRFAKPTPFTIGVKYAIGVPPLSTDAVNVYEKTARRFSVDYAVPGMVARENASFVPCTVMMLLKDKKHEPILATYEYMAARLLPLQDKVIIGVKLRQEQKGQIVIPSLTLATT